MMNCTCKWKEIALHWCFKGKILLLTVDITNLFNGLLHRRDDTKTVLKL
jgi:hypothetical protein